MNYSPPSSQNQQFFDAYPYEAALKQPNVNSSSKLPKLPSNNYIDYMTSTIITHTSTQCHHDKSINDLKYVFEHLRLENFKTQSCKVKGQHNFKMCPFFHNLADKRRLGNFYSSDFCEDITKNNICSNGDYCKKSHNLVEQLYCQDQYKTKFCSFYPKNIELCDYGRYCSFAHDESELLVELIHNYVYDDDFLIFWYKTVWCPFTFFQHDKNLCVYAHNFQDFRRKPVNNKYLNTPCPQWSEKSQVVSYMDGCPKGSLCDKCHGWYEYEFHPMNYKTKECEKKQQCTSKINCPYFHDNNDKRGISQELLWNMFRIVPKNRIVSKTFKVNKHENIFFEVNSKSAKSFLINQRAMTSKKNNKSSRMNRLGSSPHIDTSSGYFYETNPAEPMHQSQTSLSNIPNIPENENFRNYSDLWIRQNIERKAEFMRNEGSTQSIEERKDEKESGPPSNSQKSIKEKENEEFLERQFSNILKKICEDDNDDLTPISKLTQKNGI